MLARLRDWLTSNAPKAGKNLKFAAHVLASHGVTLGGLEHDTMLESYVLNSTATKHDLDSIATRYLGLATTKYEELVGKGAKQIVFDQVEVAIATRYAGEAADAALRVHHELARRLHALPDLERVYLDIERPLLRVLERMERAGVMVDARMLRAQSQELAITMAATSERRSPRPAGRSTWGRRSSCRRSSTTASRCPCSARPRRDSRRRRRTCSSSSRKPTTCRGSCSSIARCRS